MRSCLILALLTVVSCLITHSYIPHEPDYPSAPSASPGGPANPHLHPLEQGLAIRVLEECEAGADGHPQRRPGLEAPSNSPGTFSRNSAERPRPKAAEGW